MKAAAGILLALLLSGCDMPQPFRHAVPNPLLGIGARAGVVVMPVDTAPQPDELAEALAAALVEADMAATTGPGNSASYRVYGSVAEIDGATMLIWRLWTPDGRPLASHRQRLAPAMLEDADGMRGAAKEAAQAMVGVLADNQGRLDAAPRRRVAVRTVSGAPGDGNASLAAALRRALSGAGYAANAADSEADRIVHGRVTIAPGPTGYDLVGIEWRVEDATGRELGRVQQGNPVPSGSLEGAWGELAHLVAAAAAPGIDEVLQLTKPAE